ncbi:MBL fold metallo-hydrolase [Tissierella praeacuta]|uniref:MBL fold metallo-hydrolase n=1 Tax=Tissierella praeacuta TaxID=43131 RepID=UPI00333E9D4C
MNKLNVKIEHIFHSGFTVETENYLLVFDYYKGNIYLKNKNTIVFATHCHEDHFNSTILEWKNLDKNINYVFSSDIDIKGEKIYNIKPYEELELEGIKIKTFSSTDAGVSFLINIDNINIFHAGDLNWWCWDDDTEEEKTSMEKAFKEEISKIKDYSIDIAFFPVDPRLETAFSLGGEYFIEEVKPKYFIPMHFEDKFSTTTDFIHKIGDVSTNIVEITHRNQIICI